ncbi:hypothetical protein OERS_05050 [Oerskovia enterophila]|uniref:Uncharacterized protein n=2 Tax=Oerskovia enterophila TaxID=43678 RepID=A0ABX2Y8J8_9CELL|nr:hypothetical protein OERS_05050 [Oerskovia enterophila]
MARGDVVGCRYGHRMLPPVPDTWPPVPDGLLDAAHRTALDALSLVRFERYYDVAGNYAGATFASIEPNDPMDVTAADLHALTMLAITVGPGATRRVLEDGPVRDGLLAALIATPTGTDLVDASAAELDAAWDLTNKARAALADPTTKSESDPWVTAAKLAARKRPRLLPVRDTLVRRLLGLEPARDGRLEIQVIRSLVADPAVLDAIEAALARARTTAAAEGRTCVYDTTELRLLDVALWMHAAR